MNGDDSFLILSSGGGESNTHISPDCDVCPDCLHELFDPANRRYRYPFINCTNCGPRYSIITGTPYDRALTTMSDFDLCDDCLAEYYNPADRRFHAQPNACPTCGPRLRLLDASGRETGRCGDASVTATIGLLREGKIVAVKGIGGYHLAVDACNEEAVLELRRRKRRDEKPFALMSAGLAEVSSYAVCGKIEQQLLSGTERPVVLLKKREANVIARMVAPANDYFGVMLPSTPLHHLLLRENFTALVMTSGNVSDEPIAYAEEDAVARLAGIADFFLTNDRRIHTATDDSVIRVFQGGPLFLRRSRGFAPRGIQIPAVQRTVLATGAELKATSCITRGNTAFLSQHIGDLKNVSVQRFLEETASHLRHVLDVEPEIVAHDLHPDYYSTTFAAQMGLPTVGVQHHHAHLASCLAENRVEEQAIGVIFDGTGYGPDGTIWGGEFLLGDCRSYRRIGHFSQVPMPGGDAAVKEPYRMALAYCRACYGDKAFELPLPFLEALGQSNKKTLARMMDSGINSPSTSSCGRMFDAVAAIIGLRNRVSYEGQAALELEALAERCQKKDALPFQIVRKNEMLVADCTPTMAAVVEGMLAGQPPPLLARSFHDTIVAASADMCGKIREDTGVNRVVLSGGVFQNRLLTEGLFHALQQRGYDVFVHRLVPPNDGGLALGQAVVAGRMAV